MSSSSTETPRKDLLQGTSLWADSWSRLKKNSMSMISIYGLGIILFLCFIVAWFGFIKDPNQIDLFNQFAPPSGDHWLGTDQLGRDLLSRVLFGGQISLFVGFVATTLSVIIGVVYGSISGYAGGRTDTLMMRIVDVLYGLPFLVLVILFSILVREYSDNITRPMIEDWGWDRDRVVRVANLVPLIIAIGILGWLTMARMARAQVMALRKQEFVEAAISLGISNTRILFRHIVPNILGPVIIYATLTVPSFVLTEASLSFLGLGVEAPNASWGILIKDGANFMETQPGLLIAPAVAFSLTLLFLNFLGDGLRDALDPKSAKD